MPPTSLEAFSFQRLHPRTYLERFLAEGIRPDGREDDGWRPVSVNTGSITTADGSALVRVGDTTIVCGVKAEIAEPDLERPGEGFIVPNIDLSAICSPRFKSGPPGEEAQVLSERLNEAITASGVVPLTSLCIEPGKAVWVLYVDATCINYDGNAFDATLLAIISALRTGKGTVRHDHFNPNVYVADISTGRLPRATYSFETSTTTVSRDLLDPIKVDVARLPLPFSFGILTSTSTANAISSKTRETTHLLADPTSFEEPLLQSTITIVLYPTGEVGGISLTGGWGGNDRTNSCIETATKRIGYLSAVFGIKLM
ncbi:hypothetical protein BS47DRAFT_1390417 [Hydnum rufescens UP504]|uniref:Ribosomal RNA-processing protein 43 n=1 Tax=Hydnum rufescens UP504 TaxID=1448309 RepID=A0A9P6B3D5_9AGAM|nr:hypothetical protein BS47DRAFT_1390417 [Hydnum rufescens UP504]